jgi:hypothetical protein
MTEPLKLARTIRRNGGRLLVENGELRVWGTPKSLADEVIAEAPALIRWLAAEETLIDRWVANRVIAGAEWCQHCRLPFRAGEAFTDVQGSDGVGRFHRDCFPEWREAMTREARLALGFE